MLLIVVRHISQTVSLRGPLASFVVQFIVFVVMTMMSVCQGKVAKDPTAALGVCVQCGQSFEVNEGEEDSCLLGEGVRE